MLKKKKYKKYKVYFDKTEENYYEVMATDKEQAKRVAKFLWNKDCPPISAYEQKQEKR
jgi:hypothetical protein